MKYIYNIAAAVLLVVNLVSCETQIDSSKLLDSQQLIVINGYIAPQDDVIKIQVSKSKSRANASSLDPENLVIKNAVVSIKNEAQIEIFLDYNANTRNYEVASSMYVIEPGKTYFLTVVVDGDTYTSSCKIPARSAANLQAEITLVEDLEYITIYDFSLDFDDPPNFENFYVNGLKKIIPITNSDDIEESLFLEESDVFMTDSNKDGATISITKRLSNVLEEGETLKIQVTSVEKILYDTLLFRFLNIENEEDPFSDPIILPSNIEGKNGYGVFAGYQLAEKEVTL